MTGTSWSKEGRAMKKKLRTRRATYWGMAAKTTSRDWGFKTVPGKGGKTTNFGSTEKAHDK